MRGTLKNFLDSVRLTLGTRGFPLLFALVATAGTITVFACDDTGPTPIGEHPEPDAEAPAAPDASVDAEADAGEDAGGEPEDAGDAGDAGDADAGDAKADG